jgi:hypothetical protein
VDRGEDGAAGGEGDAVEVVEDGLLRFLAGGGGERCPADRDAVGAGFGVGEDPDVDRRGKRCAGALLFRLLLPAESRHRFPRSKRVRVSGGPYRRVSPFPHGAAVTAASQHRPKTRPPITPWTTFRCMCI